MASNPTPDDTQILISLAEDLADGCHTHEVSIGIKQNTEVVIRAAITAVNNAIMAQGGGEAALTQAKQALASQDEAGAAVIKNCRLWLVKKFGAEFNGDWQSAGFPDNSTAVPRTADKRFPLLHNLANYFNAHPALESTDMEATKALCDAAYTAISDARAGLNAADNNLDTLDSAYDTAVRTLRKRVRGLIDELGTLLPDDDNRYLVFGLNIPATPTVPEPIASVTLANLGNAKVLAKWPYAARMARTRVLLLRVGVDADFVSGGTVDGLEKLITDIATGQTLKVKVVAYNDGGDAPASPEASIVVS